MSEDDKLLEAQLALKDCMDELEQVKSEREDWEFGSNANAREMQRLDAELRKTREMVRELVGALGYYGCPQSWEKDSICFRDCDHGESPTTEMWMIGGKCARTVLAKYADEIDQLGREQNGASSTKVMGGME